MNIVSEKQVRFNNFAEVKNFLHSINDDVDLSRSAPDNALFSKSQGIVAGASFKHLINKINEKFGTDLDPDGCIQSYVGYLFTFRDKIPFEQIEANKTSEELSSKTKEQLLEIAKEKGLEVKASMKKEDIISAITSA